MLQYRLYGGHSLPADLEGLVKAGANIGSVIGQFLFGYLADSLGRKAICASNLTPCLLPAHLRARRQRAHAHYLCDDHDHHDAYRYFLIPFPLRTILIASAGSLSPNSALVYLAVWRILLGVGVGGDYPMSASITSDRANLRKRGTLLAYIFANQGWGSFAGSLATIAVLACYKHAIEDKGEISKTDGGARRFLPCPS